MTCLHLSRPTGLAVSGELKLNSMRCSCLLALTALTSAATAYVPAIASNAAPLNPATDWIQVNWLSGLGYSVNVGLSRLLANTSNSQRTLFRGAFVNFDSSAGPATYTRATWIALISCDGSTGNAASNDTTNALASAASAGALLSILYSQTATACALSSSFAAQSNGTMDVYTTVGPEITKALTSVFGNTDASARDFNSTTLSASANAINAQIISLQTSLVNSQFIPGAGSVTAVPPTDGSTSQYLLATVSNGQATTNAGILVTMNQYGAVSTNINPVLLSLSLTAVVSSLVLLLLIGVAWRRTLRNPSRYGPRAANPSTGDAGRTRIAGLSQAILDTIPITKYLRDSDKPKETDVVQPSGKTDIELAQLEYVTGSAPIVVEAKDVETTAGVPTVPAVLDATVDADVGKGRMSQSPQTDEVDDSLACPICLIDFEDGDDIRVLPCHSRHRFHDACVVPWLLKVSSLCPICRHDLASAREAVEAANAEANEEAAEGAIQANEVPAALEQSTSRVSSTASPSSPTRRNWRATLASAVLPSPAPRSSRVLNSDYYISRSA